MNNAVTALSALAQESRLSIFRYLIQAGPEGRVVGQISQAVAIPAATLSFHLKTLLHAGLIESRSEGRYVRYVANFAAMHGLIAFLSESCCGGNAGLCAPDAASSASSLSICTQEKCA